MYRGALKVKSRLATALAHTGYVLLAHGEAPLTQTT